MIKNIYLDYAATTPVDERVKDLMIQYLTQDGKFGNPSSSHIYGKEAKMAVENARIAVSDTLKVDPSEIIWTSGATESNNLALKGAAALYQKKGKHIITLNSEHASVLDCCQYLEKSGYQVTYLNPEANGLLNIEALKAAIRPDTILVSVMHVNNEIGVIQDIAAIGKICEENDILFHVDAVQSAGKIKIPMEHISLLSLSAHKLYGPKGIGALYIRKKPRVRLAQQIHGGGQEFGMRAGTYATHQIVGMGKAYQIAHEESEKNFLHLQKIRDYFWNGIKQLNVSVNGAIENSFPGIINICFKDHKADEIMKKLPHIALSSGSACLSKGIEPSRVLRALGLSIDLIASSLRFSFGKYTTIEEIDGVIKELALI